MCFQNKLVQVSENYWKIFATVWYMSVKHIYLLVYRLQHKNV